MTIEPDPILYYHKYLSFFGMASFDTATIQQRYMPVMTREGSGDSFLKRGGDIGIFWGSSQKWGIFCNRIDWEIAVIATSGNIKMPNIGGLGYMDAGKFRKYIESQYRHKPLRAIEFVERFLINYRI